MRVFYFVLACLVSAAAIADEPGTESLPQPLTLDYALSLVENDHPDILMAESRIQSGEAALAQQQGASAIQIDAQGKVRWIGLSVAPGTVTQDNSLGLTISKRIYDFGYSNAGNAAAQSQLESYRLQYLNVKSQRYLLIMRLYFDVILADKISLRDAQFMATQYGQYDRTRERAKLGQASELQVREKQVAYEKSRLAWSQSESMQRISRARLAMVLNYPQSLPGDLIVPKLKTHKRVLPELEDLQKLASDNNTELLALREQLKASEARVLQARKNGMPSINAEVGINNYSRPIGQREDWSVGVVITMPLMDGGQNKAQISKAEADYYQILAQLRQREMEVAQAVLELWADLQRLKVKRDEIWANYDYRQMYLDRSRTMYRQQLTTDLGDSMVEMNTAEIAVFENDFSFALAWAQLDAMTGQLFKTDATQQGGQQ